MPTQSPSAALLAMSAFYDEDDHPSNNVEDSMASLLRIPWCWPAWQQRTSVHSNPFTPQHDSNSLWESAESTLAVWSFTNNFWALSEQDRWSYIKRGLSDNDHVGRVAWLDWT